MAVKIGHASRDENGTSGWNGAAVAGDQDAKEVCTRNWYNKPWTSVFRAKDRAAAEKIAKAMEQACANDKIGYDQSQRTTLYTLAEAAGWDLSKITTACECDCSSLVAVCVNAAGIAVSKDMRTAVEKSLLEATGAFKTLVNAKYLDSDNYLERGDILLGDGHTAVVLSNDSAVTTADAQYYRVRKSWDDPTSQIGAYFSLDNAKRSCPDGYTVYDWYGNAVWPESYTLDAFIRDVQSTTGAAVDGVAGPETLRKTVTISACFNRSHAVVKAVQQRLQALGYEEVGTADGNAGPKFTSALAHFQQANGCTPTGIAEEWGKTWQLLLGMV